MKASFLSFIGVFVLGCASSGPSEVAGSSAPQMASVSSMSSAGSSSSSGPASQAPAARRAGSPITLPGEIPPRAADEMWTTSRANSGGAERLPSHIARGSTARWCCVAPATAIRSSWAMWICAFRRRRPRAEASPSGSARRRTTMVLADDFQLGKKMMAGERALHVIPLRRLQLGLSGWRSLSAKTRVNLALTPGGCCCGKDGLRLPS
jgi:hypothetical protein